MLEPILLVRDAGGAEQVESGDVRWLSREDRLFIIMHGRALT